MDEHEFRDEHQRLMDAQTAGLRAMESALDQHTYNLAHLTGDHERKIMLLWGCIQELKARVEALESKG